MKKCIIEENWKEILSSWSKAKDYVFPRLINLEYSEENLEDLLHEKFLDLYLIYILKSPNVDEYGGIQSIKITKELAESLNVDISMVKEAAINNLKTKESFCIEPLENLMRKIMGLDTDELNDSVSELRDNEIYVITNRKSRVFGSSVLLHDELLEKIFKENVVIIPSSIHEVLFIKQESADIDEIRKIISAVNQECVSEKDRLSDSPYIYDSAKKQIQVA